MNKSLEAALQQKRAGVLVQTSLCHVFIYTTVDEWLLFALFYDELLDNWISLQGWIKFHPSIHPWITSQIVSIAKRPLSETSFLGNCGRWDQAKSKINKNMPSMKAETSCTQKKSKSEKSLAPKIGQRSEIRSSTPGTNQVRRLQLKIWMLKLLCE